MDRYTVQFCRDDHTQLKWYIKAVFHPPYDGSNMNTNNGPSRFDPRAAAIVIDDLAEYNITATSFNGGPNWCPSISITFDNEPDEAEFMMRVSSGLITLSEN